MVDPAALYSFRRDSFQASCQQELISCRSLLTTWWWGPVPQERTLAARLTENGRSRVLLLEAGERDRTSGFISAGCWKTADQRALRLAIPIAATG